MLITYLHNTFCLPHSTNPFSSPAFYLYAKVNEEPARPAADITDHS